MKLKLHRDKVVSVVLGKDLVGVYIKKETIASYRCNECGNQIEWTIHNYVNGKPVCEACGDNMDFDGYNSELLLAEMSPTKADQIIKLWNTK